MEKKIIIMASLLFLSGCNLNAEPGDLAIFDHESEVMMNEDVISYQAGAIQAFDQQKFDAALADGKTIFLDFYATWCPTCRTNEPIVNAVFDDSIDTVGFRVDYDNEIELKKTYSVTTQSTYIVIRNGEESDRYLGALTQNKIAELLGN